VWPHSYAQCCAYIQLPKAKYTAPNKLVETPGGRAVMTSPEDWPGMPAATALRVEKNISGGEMPFPWWPGRAEDGPAGRPAQVAPWVGACLLVVPPLFSLAFMTSRML